MLDPKLIETAIEKGDAQALAHLIQNGELKLEGNKLVGDPEKVSEAYNFWDRRQLITKILLNS
jgi:hypothetical protein